MWFSTLGCVNFQSKSTKNITKKKPTVVYSQQQRFLATATAATAGSQKALLAGAGQLASFAQPWERQVN